MSNEARIRINSHRLMREKEESVHEVRVDDVRKEIVRRNAKNNKATRRILVHIGVFIHSFIFTVGFLVLSVLLWVRPDTFFQIVLVCVFSSILFVTSFVILRMIILHTFLDEYPDKEEDPGVTHHIPKSIVYGFVALVFAILLTGVLIKIASASTL